MPNSSAPTATADPQRALRRRTVLVAASVALLSVVAVGCGNAGTSGAAAGATGPPQSSAATPSAASPSGVDGGATTTGTATAEPPAPATTAPAATRSGAPQQQSASSRCTVTGLKLTLGRGDPGAGNIYYPLDFTNTTSQACTLDGFPGVSLLRGDGSVIGRPADRRGAKPAAVRLGPGQTVEADLRTLNQGVKDGSCWRKPTLITVYPPGSTDSMTLATSNPVVCGDTFDVGPVH
jgi:hypothetical protein